MDLVPRLFDPQRGDILLDGVPLTELPLATLRSEIGYVPQESLLFSDTIGANVAYGVSDSDVDANANRDEIVRATEIAQLRETIEGLPDGFDTRLGERGINLSGGQKQRTAMARALARRPHIVLLDDALTAVDTHTEAAILAPPWALRHGVSPHTASARCATRIISSCWTRHDSDRAI
jgi:ATP-binding cassette subfamily B protein